MIRALLGWIAAASALLLAVANPTASVTAPAGMGAPKYPDPRNLFNGTVMLEAGYLDQPYCAISPTTQAWVCVITADAHHEGGVGEQVISVTSRDGGATWSKPSVLEPSTTVANSYANIVVNSNGRMFAMYNINLDNVTALPDGKPLVRSDELGHFAMRFTDNDGTSWSAERFLVPYRQTPIDHANSWNGSVDIMWSVDQVKTFSPSGGGRRHRDDTPSAVYAFTKIGTYPQGPPEEVFFLASDNLLEPGIDPAQISWSLYPDGDHGLAPPGDNPNIMEEGHILPLRDGAAWYAVARTTQGYLAASYASALPGPWAPSGFAMTWNSSLAGEGNEGKLVPALPVKNPRGPITPRQFAALGESAFLMLFYFNSDTSYESRNPYWLVAGREADSGNSSYPGRTVLWSQPEIALYDRATHSDRPGYPDMFESGGRFFITETQKTVARIHTIDPELVGLLASQHTIRAIKPGWALSFNSSTSSPLPFPPLAPLNAPPSDPRAGFTLELLLNLAGAKPGQPILSVSSSAAATMGPGNNGAAFLSVALGSTGGSLVFAFGDGKAQLSISTSGWCADRIRTLSSTVHVALIVDAGPNIALLVLDGTDCDGGAAAKYGWLWIPDMGAPGGSSLRLEPAFSGSIQQARLYRQRLCVSEVIGNYRAQLYAAQS